MASITKRGNSYRIRVSNGYDENGKQQMRTTTWHPDPYKSDAENQAALEQFAYEFQQQTKGPVLHYKTQMTYREYVKQWLETYAEQQMEQTSYACTANMLRLHVLPTLGEVKLAEITPLLLSSLYTELLMSGYLKNGTQHYYKASTIKRIHDSISSSLSTATQWGLIDSNPCDKVKPPKMNKQIEPKHFNKEQSKTFLKALDHPACNVSEQMKVFYYMALYGGFRRGELIALTWNDIDFKKNTVSITKSAAVVRGKQINKSPKNYTSIRIVNLPKSVMDMLKTYKNSQTEHRLSIGNEWQGDNYVFIQRDGRQMHVDTPTKIFRRILRTHNSHSKNHLPLISLHGLRHTSATLLIAQHVDVKTVSARLGHANTSTTLNIYAHSLKEMDSTAAKALASILD
ncbi:MAG: site-specific integrase [Eubacteriales bacterium]|nr:site-specific integrase [Eubacteriales bacterium]